MIIKTKRERMIERRRVGDGGVRSNFSTLQTRNKLKLDIRRTILMQHNILNFLLASIQKYRKASLGAATAIFFKMF